MNSSLAHRKVAGLTANLAPYHHARWQAFAERSGTTCFVLELTNKDEFPVMEYQTAGASYERITLFPGQLEAKLTATEITQRVARALDQQRPDCVCLSGYATPLALGALHWCARNRVPAVMLSESTVWDEPRQPWKEWIKSRVLRLCSSALVGGAPHADYMAQLGIPRDRLFLGYDVVDNDHFARGAASAKSHESELRQKHQLPDAYFMASARFIPKKNLPRLLEAYARYRQLAAPAPWDLVVLGDGAGREALRTLRAQLGLEKNVHLVGAKPYPELPAYYGLASAFIHASTTEQWGLVVNEAMASGLPVLVSRRCGCAQDLVQDGVNGVTFDPYQVEDIAQTMLRLASSAEQLSAFRRASQEIIANWSPQRFADGLSEAVEAAISTPRPRPTWFDLLLLGLLMHR